jgi:hypothetical protein
MRKMRYTALLLSFALLLASTASLEAAPAKVTAIILTQVPKSAYFGDEVKVTGRLLEAGTGEGIANAEVKIIDNKPVAQEILGSTKTRKYGFFTATFKSSLGERDRTLNLIVKYDGSADHTASTSREQTIMLKLLPLEITFLYLKSFYKHRCENLSSQMSCMSILMANQLNQVLMVWAITCMRRNLSLRAITSFSLAYRRMATKLFHV